MAYLCLSLWLLNDRCCGAQSPLVRFVVDCLNNNNNKLILMRMVYCLWQHKSTWWPWPLTFDLKTGAHYCPCGGQPFYQFWCFWDFFLSRLMGQYLSDAPRDLITLTFDLGGHGEWYGSKCSICGVYQVWSYQAYQIWCTSAISISQSGDFDLWPFDL